MFATFQGTIRSDNNGGFASVRCSLGSGIDLSQFEGFYVDARAPADAATAAKQRFAAKDAGRMRRRSDAAAFAGWVRGGPRRDRGVVRADQDPVRRVRPPGTHGSRAARGPLKANAVCEVGLMVLKEFGGASASTSRRSACTSVPCAGLLQRDALCEPNTSLAS